MKKEYSVEEPFLIKEKDRYNKDGSIDYDSVFDPFYYINKKKERELKERFFNEFVELNKELKEIRKRQDTNN